MSQNSVLKALEDGWVEYHELQRRNGVSLSSLSHSLRVLHSWNFVKKRREMENGRVKVFWRCNI